MCIGRFFMARISSSLCKQYVCTANIIFMWPSFPVVVKTVLKWYQESIVFYIWHKNTLVDSMCNLSLLDVSKTWQPGGGSRCGHIPWPQAGFRPICSWWATDAAILPRGKIFSPSFRLQVVPTWNQFGGVWLSMAATGVDTRALSSSKALPQPASARYFVVVAIIRISWLQKVSWLR